MARYVAFLRAINVGGSHVVKMDALRRHFERTGFTDVETFIASGNVVFASPSKSGAALERKIEAALADALGYEVNTFVRTPGEIAAIAAHRPFAEARMQAAAALCVGFLPAALDAPALARVLALRTPIDDLHVHGREIYWLCTTSQSKSTFSNALLEKTLNTRSTLRGLGTIRKLAAKFPG